VNRFWIDYTPTGGIDQFYSDISVLDKQEKRLSARRFFVNEPLRYRGVTFYQTGVRLIQHPNEQKPSPAIANG